MIGVQVLADYGLRGVGRPTTTATSIDRAALYAEAARISRAYKRSQKATPVVPARLPSGFRSSAKPRRRAIPARSGDLPLARSGSKLPDGVYRLPNGGRRYVGAEVCAANMFQRKVRAADKGGFDALREVR